MGKKLKIKSGNTTLEIPNDLNNTFQKVIDSLLPESKREITRIVEEIEQEARSDWLVRRTPTGKKSTNSKDSKSKIYSEIYITPNLEIAARIGNKAPYAWAIRVGVRSETNLPMKKRISNELLFKPMKKQSDKIAEVLARDTTKLMKK